MGYGRKHGFTSGRKFNDQRTHTTTPELSPKGFPFGMEEKVRTVNVKERGRWNCSPIAARISKRSLGSFQMGASGRDASVIARELGMTENIVCQVWSRSRSVPEERRRLLREEF